VTDKQTRVEESLAKTYELAVRSFGAPDLAEPRAGATPQQMYTELTLSDPVRDLGDGFYSVLRMDDILHLTRHSGVKQATEFLGSDRPAIPLGLDGPEHTKYRKLLDPVFTAKRVAPLAPAIRKQANLLIDRFMEAGKADAYLEWCEPLPSSIFLSIMGLPMDDLDDFLHFKNLTLGNDQASGYTDEERVARRMEAVGWIQGYFNRDLEEREREAQPRDDMIGWLLTTEIDGHRLSREELLDILGLLMIAGLDTVTASLACFLSYLARHPEQRARIIDQPEILPSAVEELMRFESPVSEGYRKTIEAVELPSGATLPAGAYVHVSWSAANLDPDFFDDPLNVDLERSPNRHIGFASGYHRCLGSHLARMELQIAMAVWHERIPHYRIAEGAELTYSANPRAPHSLPLVWR
jgi:cytochrome P450